jgi:hypothetical protein
MHYDLIMMLMSKNDMVFKTQIIYEYMIIDAKYNWGDWYFINAAPYWCGIFIPLYLSFVVLISYSVISPVAFRISSYSRYHLQLIRRKYDKKTPVSAEKFIEIQEKFNQKSDEFHENSLKHGIEIDSYKKINEETQTMNFKLKEKTRELREEISELESKLTLFEYERTMVAQTREEHEDYIASEEYHDPKAAREEHEDEIARKKHQEAQAVNDTDAARYMSASDAAKAMSDTEAVNKCV